jgi:hypothetical protein
MANEAIRPLIVIPAKAGIQYAVACRFNHCCLGMLDRPPQCARAHKADDDN